MKTKILMIVLTGLLAVSFASVGLVSAKSDNPGKGEQPANIGRPEKLEQIIFVHPVAPEKPGQPDKARGKPPKEPEEPKDNTYYELWADGLGTIPSLYYINPNVNLVTNGDPIEAVKAAAEAWNSVTANQPLSYAGTTNLNWYAEDGENTVSWVKFIPRDYIAIAVMWYDENMIIWEVDIVFNAFHNWGIEPGKRDRAFDIQNIATHEFGHPVGLDDLYDDIYSELTMYGYSRTGETIKCSLEEGDIAGAQFLYGNPTPE